MASPTTDGKPSAELQQLVADGLPSVVGLAMRPPLRGSDPDFLG